MGEFKLPYKRDFVRRMKNTFSKVSINLSNRAPTLEHWLPSKTEKDNFNERAKEFTREYKELCKKYNVQLDGGGYDSLLALDDKLSSAGIDNYQKYLEEL